MYDPENLIYTPNVPFSDGALFKKVSVSRSKVVQTVDPATGETIERLIAGRPYQENEVVGIFGGEFIVPANANRRYLRKTRFLDYSPGRFSQIPVDKPDETVVMVQDGNWRRSMSLQSFLERGHAASLARQDETGHNAVLMSFTCEFEPETDRPLDDTNLGTRRGVSLLLASRVIEHGEEIMVPGKR